MPCASLMQLRQVANAGWAAAAARGNSRAVYAAATRGRRKKSSSSGGAPGEGSGSGSGGDPAVGSARLATAVAAAAASGPLFDRRLLAEKLTLTAKAIEWIDLPQDRQPESTRQQIQELEKRLGYEFQNRYLLRLALIHSSAATTHNSIMAWIGDAALYLIVAEEVSAALGNVAIGKLSEVRKTLIGRAMCERYAAHLGLGPYLVMGKSVRKQSQTAVASPSSNMAAELFEAVMGAVYLDGDLDAVRQCYTAHFPLPADPYSLLQADGTGGTISGDANPWD